jgi:hypothetical protein
LLDSPDDPSNERPLPSSRTVIYLENEIGIQGVRMIGRARGMFQSRRARGVGWLVAAVPMIAVPALAGGNRLLLAVGLMFLVFGIVEFGRKA